jgi:hypothetical protein
MTLLIAPKKIREVQYIIIVVVNKISLSLSCCCCCLLALDNIFVIHLSGQWLSLHCFSLLRITLNTSNQ